MSNMIGELESIKLEIADIKKTLFQKADLDRIFRPENRVVQLESQLAVAR